MNAQFLCPYRSLSVWSEHLEGEALEPDGEVGEVGSERGGREWIVGVEGVEGGAGAGHGGVEGAVVVELVSQSG